MRNAFYLVQSKLKNQAFICEADLDQADIFGTVSAIAAGQFDTGEIETIYRLDPVRHTLTDETTAVLELVAQHLTRTNTVPCEAVSKLLWQHGISYAPHLMAAE